MRRASRLGALTFLLILFLGAAPPAGAENEPPRPWNFQYLFLVDSSLSMGAKKKAVIRTIHDLIATGFHGRAQTGDRIGMWLCNQEFFNTSFPTIEWGAEESRTNAAAATRFLSDYHFDSRPKFDKLHPHLGRAVNNASNLTLILIHNGAPLDWESPFDKQVNAIYAARLSAMRRANRPFITMFIVQNGRMTNYRVHTLEEILELPEVPAPAPQAVTTNLVSQPEPAKTATIVTNLPTPIETSSSNVVAKVTEPAPEPPNITTNAVATPEPPAPPTPLANTSPPVVEAVATNSPIAQLPELPKTPEPAPEPPKEYAPTPKVELTKVQSPAPTPVPAPALANEKNEKPAAPPAPAPELAVVEVELQPTKSSPVVFGIAFIAVALAGFLLALFMKGNRKPGRSFISSSLTMHGDGK